MEITWTWSTPASQFIGESVETIIEICRYTGMSGVEGGERFFTGYTDAELDAFGKAFQDAGLNIYSFHLPFSAEDDISSFYETERQASVDKALLWMENAARVGSKAGIQHPTTNRYNVDIEGLDIYMRQLGKSLETLLSAAEELDFTIAMENMTPGEGGGRFASRPEHFTAFIKAFAHPHLGFCLDTGHALMAAEPGSAGELLDVMAPHLVALHLADNAGDRDSHLAPGHGLVEWDPVFRKAAEMKFSNPVCIETPPFASGPPYSRDARKQMVDDTMEMAEKALRD